MPLFGGTAPWFATWLVARYHTLAAPALYLSLPAAGSLGASLHLRKPVKTKLR